MLTESNARGNVTLQELQSAFDEQEAERIGKTVGYWPGLKDLYDSLGLRPDREPVPDQGLIGPNIDKYRTAFEALRLINLEFPLLRPRFAHDGAARRREEKRRGDRKERQGPKPIESAASLSAARST
jgi:hypothetical protein